jgi:glycolate oxidase FAD binding subunit
VVAQATVVDDLRSIVGDKHAYPPDNAGTFDVDDLSPQAVAEPGSYEQVAALTHYANEAGLAVIPLSGMTKRHVGNVPTRYDIALSLSRLNSIVEHEPADLTVTCPAGISVPELQRRLGEHGQRIAFDVSPGQQPSVGGLLAANANGPSRAAYGAIRDFTIGMRVVTADGRITRAGGKVVKNVAGYDLCKLYIGSLGTLGIIVEATFKVMPVARCERSLTLRFDAPSDACSLAREAHRRGLAISQVYVFASPINEDGWFLELGLAGSEGAVERSESEVIELAAGFEAESGAKFAGTLRDGQDEGQLLCRFSGMPSRLAALIEDITRLESPTIVAEPATGVLRASWAEMDAALPLLDRARRVATKHSATCLIERCPPAVKQRIDVFGDPPPAFELMRRVKQQFDPKGILSPGRFVGRL